MKADTLFPASPLAPDDGDPTPLTSRTARSDRQAFVRALDDAAPAEAFTDIELDGGGETAADRDRRDKAPPEEKTGLDPVEPTPVPLPRVAWLLERLVAAVRSPVDAPPSEESALAGADRVRGRPATRERSTPPAGVRSAELPGERRDPFESAAAVPVERVPASPERAVPGAARLEQAAAEAEAQVGVLSRAAHILVNSEQGRGLELHLRVLGDRSELRVAGPLAPLVRARLAELQLALAAQGVPLAAIEMTESLGGSPSDGDQDPPGREPGGREGFSRVRAIKA